MLVEHYIYRRDRYRSTSLALPYSLPMTVKCQTGGLPRERSPSEENPGASVFFLAFALPYLTFTSDTAMR